MRRVDMDRPNMTLYWYIVQDIKQGLYLWELYRDNDRIKEQIFILPCNKKINVFQNLENLI